MPTKTPADTRSIQEFLAQEVYLPKYMNMSEVDYNGKEGLFRFGIREPPVARGDIVHYATPRGYHICISQATYALTEHLLREGKLEELGDVNPEQLRATLLTGRVKIGRLDEHFRRELLLKDPVEARVGVRRIKNMFNSPHLEFYFDFANRSMWGKSLSSIAPQPVTSLNAGATRF